ncbi:MAG TPA: hypothetical protein VFO01_06355 [Trebonia sp.]|nr:hypothetical protein [Trebonia sp.]
MSAPADGYDAYYQARLWNSLPEIYRAMDYIDDDTAGPLRELLNRIGVQMAVARRGIDGLWADQFIETCAGWVIPYIGALVATSQVTGLDPRGQRLDVANTVGWRRTKGTLPTAGEVARDITGWDSRVVEGFRRLARTWHQLDPAPAVAGAAAPGRTEPFTRTPQGGFADLRSAPGALLAGGPFDQAFHHADLRRGGGAVGWFGAEKLTVHCWRLLSLEVTGATPVPVAGRPGEYVFDPTGREVPLFLPSRVSAGTASVWEVPGPLTAAAGRIMASAGVSPACQVTGGALAAVVPEAGRFRLPAAPSGQELTVSYCHGLGGPIGAGTGALTAATPLRAAGERLVTGGSGLDAALAGAGPGDTVTIADSRTYTAVSDVTCVPAGGRPAGPLTVRARPGERPLIRFPEPGGPAERPRWVFRGGEGARLVLNGLFVSGGDIVLQGSFEHVKIVGCSFDPGTLGDAAAAGLNVAVPGRDVRRRAPGTDSRGPALTVRESVDGRALLPARLWIEPAPPQSGQSLPGQPPSRRPSPPDVVRCLEIDRSILGPVRTRGGGLAERVVVTDSILQGFRTSAGAACTAADVFDPVLLYDQLSPGRATAERPRAQPNPLSALIWRSAASAMSPAVRRQLHGPQEPPAIARQALARALNVVIGRALYRPDRWAGVPLSPQSRELLGQAAAPRAWLNRLLLEDAYPLALAPAACAVAEATVHLNRVTVLGRLTARRLQATDSILHGFAVAEDTEDGCFRYSAAVAGSRLPPGFNAAWLSGGAALFTSTAFGHPGYGQLLDTADRAIAGGTPGRSLLGGSSTGAQLGAFPAAGGPARERALRIKYNEYLPLGLVPAIVHVT